jgi:N-acyl-L-homoserine lactone synthetase
LIVERAATLPERVAIFGLRYQVFVEEMGRTDLDGVDGGTQTLRDEFDENAAHFCCKAGGRVVGAVRIGDVAGMRHAPDLMQFFAMADLLTVLRSEEIGFANWLAVAAAHHSSPVAGLLFAAASGQALSARFRAVLTFCKPGMVSLYERLGFEQYKPPEPLGAIGLRVPLLLLTRDHAHLRAVRSPLYHLLRRAASVPMDGELRAALSHHFPSLEPGFDGTDALWRHLSTIVKLGSRRRLDLFDGLSAREIEILCKHPPSSAASAARRSSARTKRARRCSWFCPGDSWSRAEPAR